MNNNYEDIGWVDIGANNNHFSVLLTRCKACAAIIVYEDQGIHSNACIARHAVNYYFPEGTAGQNVD